MDALGSQTPKFDSSIGSFVIGAFLALFLQGITLYNGMIFWLNAQKQKEPWFYRVAVAMVMLIDLASSAFNIHTVYDWCVINFMKPSAVASLPWTSTIEPALTGVMAAIVHVFYAHRVVVLAAGDRCSRPLFVVIAVLTLVQLAFSISVSIRILRADCKIAHFGRWTWATGIWLGAASLNDVIICGSYLFYLNRTSKVMAGPFERSSRAVIKVASIVLATNGLSAICAIVATVLFDVFTSANWHVIVQLTLLKLLALSLLIALNARTLLADLLGVDPGIFQSSAVRTHKKSKPAPAELAVAMSGYKKQTGGLGSLTWAMHGSRTDLAVQPEPLGPVAHSSYRPSKALASPAANRTSTEEPVFVRGADGEVYPFRTAGLEIVSARYGAPGHIPVKSHDTLADEGQAGDSHTRQPPPRGVSLARASSETVEIDDQLEEEEEGGGGCVHPAERDE
ncbi:hypothetical protein JCM3774_003413 [Rhodotorula dairenensis]